MDGVNGPDYLSLPIAWQPSRRFQHGQPYEYHVALGADDRGILRLVAGKGWALTIVPGDTQLAIDRGLFGTPDDALMVLYAEFCAEFALPGDNELNRPVSPPRPASDPRLTQR